MLLFFTRIPVFLGSTQNMEHDIIQNINTQEQLKDRTTYIKGTRSLHVNNIHTNYLGQIGERSCAVRCCFICFLKPGLLFM